MKISKRIVTICLAAVLSGSGMLLPQKSALKDEKCSFSANALETSGSCGTNLNWAYKDNVLTISGSGNIMNDFSPENPAPWASYSTQVTTVVLPAYLSNIGNYAFNNFTVLKRVYVDKIADDNNYFSRYMKNIGNYAFNGCVNFLGNGTDGVLNIGYKNGGNVAVNIGEHAFSLCGMIKKLNIYSDKCTLGYYSFDSCSGIEELVIPSNVARVSPCTFGWNTSISSVGLIQPDRTVKYIDADYVESIAGGATVKRIEGDEAYPRFEVTSGLGLTELISSLFASPLIDNVCREKADKIVKSIVSSNLTETQKLFQIYNYFITNSRYCALYGSSDINFDSESLSKYGKEKNFLVGFHCNAVGPLFFSAGMCMSRSDAMQYLCEAAGLNVTQVVTNEHAWNLYKPTGSDVYYRLDTSSFIEKMNVFCGGLESKPIVPEEAEYKIAKSYLSNISLIKVSNKSDREFKFTMSKQDDSDVVFFDYNSANYNDYQKKTCNKLTENNEKYLYIDSNQYYRFKISDNDNASVVLDMEYALNKGNSYTVPFVCADGFVYNFTINILNEDKEADGLTASDTYFEIIIEKYGSAAKIGDADGDGKYTMNDYKAIYDYVMKFKTASGNALYNCDVNMNGKIDIIDTMLFGQFINQQKYKTPVEYFCVKKSV